MKKLALFLFLPLLLCTGCTNSVGAKTSLTKENFYDYVTIRESVYTHTKTGDTYMYWDFYGCYNYSYENVTVKYETSYSGKGEVNLSKSGNAQIAHLCNKGRATISITSVKGEVIKLY